MVGPGRTSRSQGRPSPAHAWRSVPRPHKPTRGTREQRVRLGTYCNHFEMSFDDLRRIWQAADRFGFDAAVTMDNSVAGGATPQSSPRWLPPST